jgi:aryl sulfotransferase
LSGAAVSAEFLLISSYPKSGNTWTRLVFEHLLRGAETDVSINELTGAFHGRGRRIMFDTYSPVSSSDLSFAEIENLLPDLFRALAGEHKGELIVKVHECSHRNTRGEWIFPPECVRAALYLVRHPFDVAVSYANHMGTNIEATLEIMASGGEPGPDQLDSLALPLPQWTGSWSDNVESWILRSPYRSAIARYEDLHELPEQEFRRLASAARIPATDELIGRAVAATRFELLQEQEREKGFRERPQSSSVFFRSGRPKTWEGVLDEQARARIVHDHGEVMERLGYLADGSTAPMPAELEEQQSGYV